MQQHEYAQLGIILALATAGFRMHFVQSKGRQRTTNVSCSSPCHVNDSGVCVCVCAGKGRHTFLDGSYYEGRWVAGERTTGKFVSADGSSEYSGAWKGDARHGQGVLFVKGLFKYTGVQQCSVM